MTNEMQISQVKNSKEHLSLAVDVLMDAFANDPISDLFYEYVKPDRRAQLSRMEKEVCVNSAFKNGLVYQVDNFKAVALWWEPGKSMMTFSNLLFSGLLSFAWHGGLDFLKGGKEWTDKAEAAKKRHLKGREHYYLLYLATATAHQRKGYGSALLRPIIEKADKEGVPCYLEATKKTLVPYYQTFGFEVVEEIKLSFGSKDGQVSCYAMLREPKMVSP